MCAGFSYDWDREVSTTSPEYYKWTQWIFCQLFKRGLAYQAEVPVNWCPALGTVLANEEVIDGKSERGDHPVVRLPMKQVSTPLRMQNSTEVSSHCELGITPHRSVSGTEMQAGVPIISVTALQWMLRITAYADRLLEDLETLDWPDSIKDMQRNWIGRSEGATIRFAVQGTLPPLNAVYELHFYGPPPPPKHPLLLDLAPPTQDLFYLTIALCRWRRGISL